MIKGYEEQVLLWFRAKFPLLKEIIIGTPELLTFETPRVLYPSVILTREVDEWETNNIITVFDKSKSFNLYRFTQNYEGVFLMEKQNAAFDMLTKLRFKWFKEPYVYVRFNDEDLKVSLCLKYIKVETVRDNTSDKGPRREIKFAWKSELFVSESNVESTYKGFKFIIDANQEEKLTIIDNICEI